MSSAPPNWYPDPQNPSYLRWWDGYQWTPHTQLMSPQVVSQPDKLKSKKPLVIVLSLMAIIVLVFVLVGVWAVTSLFGGRLNDTQIEEINQNLQAVADETNIAVDVYESGTSCEQLCQNLYINYTLPEDLSFTSEDVRKNLTVLNSTLSNYPEVGGVLNVCFETSDDPSPDFDTEQPNSLERKLVETFKELGIPPTLSNGDYFGVGGCLLLDYEDLAKY